MSPLMIAVGAAMVFGAGLIVSGRYWVRDLMALVRANDQGFIRPSASGRTLFRATDPSAFQKAVRKLKMRLALFIWPVLVCAVGGAGAVLALTDF